MTRSYTSALVMGAIFLLLLLLSTTSLVLLTVHLLMLATVVMFVRLKAATFAVAYGAALAAAYAIPSLAGWGARGLVSIVPAMFFLAPAVVMGTLYKRRAPARSVLTAGIVALLGEMLLTLLVLTAMGIDVMGSLEQNLRNSMLDAMRLWGVQLADEAVQTTVRVITKSVPLLLIAVSFYYALLTHWLARRLLNRMGERVPGMPPVREWMLPKSFVWIYLIALILEYVIRPDLQSVLTVILLNLVPILQFAFSVQAISFLAFVAHHKGWNRALPLTAIILMLVVPVLTSVYSLLGVFDVAFPLRERFRR